MGTVHESSHPLVRHKITLLRSVTTQPKKFREIVRELTSLLAYEATADLALAPVDVVTPLTSTTGAEIIDRIALVPILRAGIGMVDGFLEVIPTAEVWHIGLYRDHQTLEPVEYYRKQPDHPLADVFYVLDPMLATGGSASATMHMLHAWGATRVIYLGLIAAPEGIARLTRDHPDTDIYVAAIDDHLDERGYIVPGLGDAGDRLFGTH